MLMNSFKLTKENAEALANQYATPIEVISLKHIEANYEFLQEHIPRLKIYYAIKANPATCILEKLKDLIKKTIAFAVVFFAAIFLIVIYYK